MQHPCTFHSAHKLHAFIEYLISSTSSPPHSPLTSPTLILHNDPTSDLNTITLFFSTFAFKPLFFHSLAIFYYRSNNLPILKIVPKYPYRRNQLNSIFLPPPKISFSYLFSLFSLFHSFIYIYIENLRLLDTLILHHYLL